jgi:hypothetical protein
MKKLVSTLGLLALFTVCACAQTYTLTPTTLATQVLKSDTQVCLASATGVLTPTISNPGTMFFVDFEPMQVTGAGYSSTCFIVDRHWQAGLTNFSEGAGAVSHVSGQTVYVAPPQQFFSSNKAVGGACSAPSEYVLPVINIANGEIFACPSGGQWIRIGLGTGGDGAIETIRAFCTGTAGSAETEYLNSAACSGATTATARYVVPQFGTIANLRVSLSAAGAGGTSKDVLTVYKNGSSTALTVTTGTTACATGAAAACIDQAHSFPVAPGDVLTFQWVSATSDTAANVGVAVGRY